MTVDDFLSLIEEQLRTNDGFWNEAEAVKVMPVRDVTKDYIREKAENAHKDSSSEGAADSTGAPGSRSLADAA